MTRLYGKVAFVEALLYVGRSSMEIQHALWQHMIMIRCPSIRYSIYLSRNWTDSVYVSR